MIERVGNPFKNPYLIMYLKMSLHWCNGQWDAIVIILSHNLYHIAYCERSGLVPQYI